MGRAPLRDPRSRRRGALILASARRRATILYRALVDSILSRSLATAYDHAARYYGELGTLSSREEQNWPIDPARTYRAGLRRRHDRKFGFWSLVESAGRMSGTGG